MHMMRACPFAGVAEEAAARLQSAEATCAAEIRQADDAVVQRRAEEARLQAQIQALQEALSTQKQQVRAPTKVMHISDCLRLQAEIQALQEALTLQKQQVGGPT